MTAILCLVGVFAFCQSAKYTELYEKAKKYETEKNYIFALGYYYDAVAEDVENSSEAYAAFDKILNAFNSGKPGLEEYDEFSLYENWLEACKKAEIYWTEHAAEISNFSCSLKRESLDMASKTATYSFSAKFGGLSEKYFLISEAMKNGLSESRTKDWVQVPEDWPVRSVFPAGSTYEKTKAAVFTVKSSYNFKDDVNTSVYTSWMGNATGYKLEDYVKAKNYSLYDIKFSICDSNGNELLRTPRFLVPGITETECPEPVMLEKVPQNIISVLEKGEIIIKIAEMFLQTGTFNVLFTKEVDETFTRIAGKKLAARLGDRELGRKVAEQYGTMIVADKEWARKNELNQYRSFIKKLSEVKCDVSKTVKKGFLPMEIKAAKTEMEYEVYDDDSMLIRLSDLPCTLRLILGKSPSTESVKSLAKKINENLEGGYFKGIYCIYGRITKEVFIKEQKKKLSDLIEKKDYESIVKKVAWAKRRFEDIDYNALGVSQEIQDTISQMEADKIKKQKEKEEIEKRKRYERDREHLENEIAYNVIIVLNKYGKQNKKDIIEYLSKESRASLNMLKQYNESEVDFINAIIDKQVSAMVVIEKGNKLKLGKDEDVRLYCNSLRDKMSR